MANNDGTVTMKILCAWCNELTYGTSYEQIHYFSTIEKLGHEVSVFPIQPTHQSDIRLLETVGYVDPDVLLCKLYRTEISRVTIRHITKHHRATTVGIFGDDEKYFHRTRSMLDKDCTVYTDEYAPMFDYAITTHKPSVKKHKDLGVKNVIYSPYGANSYMYKRTRLRRLIDTSFCGSFTQERRRLCDAIMVAGIKLKVYGNGWKGEELILEQDQYADLFNMTKVNINM